MTEITRDFNALGTTVKNNQPAEKKIIKLYDDSAKSTEAKQNAEALTTIAEAATTDTASTEQPIQESRRDVLKRASRKERALREKEEAVNQDLAKVKDFHEFLKQAKQDPTLVAKALGEDSGEFLKRYQNKVFEISDTPKAKPEEVTKQRLDYLEKEYQTMQYSNSTNRFIQDKVIPVLAKDSSKYQIINGDINRWGQYMHDLVFANYQKTGEILDVSDVAEELESELIRMAERNIKDTLEEVKKVPKLAEKFKVEIKEVPTTKSGINTLSSSIGTRSSGGLPKSETTKEFTPDGKKIVQSFRSPKEARLARTKEAVSHLFLNK